MWLLQATGWPFHASIVFENADFLLRVCVRKYVARVFVFKLALKW
jgi:hypothetical protein